MDARSLALRYGVAQGRRMQRARPKILDRVTPKRSHAEVAQPLGRILLEVPTAISSSLIESKAEHTDGAFDAWCGGNMAPLSVSSAR